MWKAIALLFLIAGIVFLFGKGGFLIAGYNTADPREREQYDEKRLNRCFAAFCFGIAIAIGVTGYLDNEQFALYFMLPVILILLLLLIVAVSTYCKKR